MKLIKFLFLSLLFSFYYNSSDAQNCSPDTTPPVAVCKDITISFPADGFYILDPSEIDNGSSDNCESVSLSLSETFFNCGGNFGANTVTLTATDDASNEHTCTSTVTFLDNIPPLAVCKDITVELSGGNPQINLSYGSLNNGSSDACGIATADFSPSPTLTCENIGTNNITMTLADPVGNTSFCSSIVTVNVAEGTAPTANCKTATITLDATGTATIPVTAVDNNSSGVCLSYELSPAQVSCADVGSVSVTLTVTDGTGATDDCITSVTVSDNTAPDAQCQNISVQLDGDGSASITAAAINNNSTDACNIVSMVANPINFDCSNLGANTVTLTLTDTNGNTNICDATVTVLDDNNPCCAAPEAVCQNLNIAVESGSLSFTPADIDAGSTADCGLLDLSLDISSVSCADVGSPATVTLTITDINENSDDCIATVTLTDSTPPVAMCKDITITFPADGVYFLDPSEIDNGSSDNCETVNLSVSQTFFICGQTLGTNTVTLTAADNASNQSTCTSTVTFIDNLPPLAVCKDISIELSSSANPEVNLSFVDLDNGSLDPCGIASATFSPSGTLTCADLGTNMITMTLADLSGNTASCNSTVTITDGTAPTASCKTATISLGADGTAIIPATDIDNNSFDNCTLSYSVSPAQVGCSDVGSVSVTLTVTDGAGNQDQCNTNVTVVDGANPSAECQSTSVQLDANGSASITAADIDNESSDACGLSSLSVSTSSFSCEDLGANTVTLTVTDVNGNTGTCDATVTVLDDNNPCCAAPSAICQNFTAVLDANGTATLSSSDIDNGSTYECGLQTITIDNSSFDCATLGSSQNVVLTVTDINGDSDNCTGQVTVVDNTAPTALCQNISVELDGSGNASITASDINNGSFDNCSIASVNASPLSFDCSNTGENTVTLTATDGSGNTNTCTAIVTVNDGTNPTVVTQDLTLYLDETGNISVSAEEVDAGSFDNCGIASMSLEVAGSSSPSTSFDCTMVGTHILTLTVTDTNGNTDSQTASMTIVDAVPAEILCRQPVVTTADPGSCSATVSAVLSPFVFSDNCGIESGITVTRTPEGNTFPVGTTILNWTVTDSNGNPATCQSEVTIESNEAPVINYTGGSSISVNLNPGTCEAAVYINATASQSCGSANISGNGYTIFGLGVHTHQITATAANGMSVSEEITVYVHDTEAPTALNCPEDITVFSNEAETGVAIPEVEFTDNCEVISVTGDLPSTFPQGTTEVNITATDSYGLQTECSFNVNIEPTISLVSPLQDIEAATASNASMVTWNRPIANTVCSVCDLPSDENYVHLGDYAGHQYFLYMLPVTWNEANILAEAMDAHVLTMNDDTERNFLFTEIFDRPSLQELETAAWTGIYNEGETWQWINGENAVINLPEMPDFNPENSYAAALSLSGEWSADNTDALRPVLIERECMTITQIAPSFETTNDEGEVVNTLMLPNETWSTGTYEIIYEVTDACNDTRLFSFDVTIDEEAEYCNAAATNSEVWLQSVMINGDMYEGEETTGYSDNTSEATEIATGDALNLVLTPAGSVNDNELSPLYRRVWVDMDDDGDFFGADEMVFETEAAGSVSTILANLPVPADMTLRLRIAASEYAYPEACADYLQGEVEDFLVSFYESEEDEGTDETNFRFTLAPNPADNYTMLKFDTHSDEEIIVTVRDILGNAVRMANFNNTVSKQHALRFDNLQDGIYIIEVQAANQSPQTQQLIINRLAGFRSLN